MTNRTERRSHQPKGAMCYSCEKSSHYCDVLPFEKMPVISQTTDGIKIVKCTEFKAAKND